MAFRFGRSGQVAGAARIVECELEQVAACEIGEDDLGLGPGERARDPQKVETMWCGHANLS